jgi:FG-GAP repeat/CHU_C Type IX secretion signal domain
MIRILTRITILLLLPISFIGTIFGQSNTDLASWNGNTSFSGNDIDRLGYDYATGDFNGDGQYDFAISAPGADANNGEVYLFFSTSAMLNEQVYNNLADNADVVVRGSEQRQIGISLCMGDLDGDQIEDLIIGAPRADNARGEVWVIFGSNNPQTEYLAPDVKITGAQQGDDTGDAIGVSTINIDDTIHDLIIGSPAADPYYWTVNDRRDSAGRVDVIFGRPNNQWPAEINLENTPSDITIWGEQSNSRTGAAISQSLSFQGDLLSNDIDANGNGDLIFGAPDFSYANRTGSGIAYIFASNVSLADTTDLILGPEFQDYKELAGGNILDSFGSSLSSFKSGVRRSLLVGAPNARFGNQQLGAVYEVPWAAISAGGVIQNMADPTKYRLKFFSSEDGDKFGQKVSVTSDDWFIGAPDATVFGRNEAGLIYWISSPPSFEGDTNINEIIEDIMYISGASPSDNIGSAFAPLFIDSDPYAEIILGSPEINNNTGEAKIIRGGLPFCYQFSPFPQQIGVPIVTDITFQTAGYQEVLNPDSTKIEIDGIEYDINNPGHPVSYESDGWVFTFTVVPENPFIISTPVPVVIRTEDSDGNESPLYSYQFVTGRDNLSPEIVRLSPAEDEINVSTTRNIEFGLIDSGEGVDSTTIRLSVNINGVISNIQYNDDQINIIGEPSDYQVIYNPDEDFPADEEIIVTIFASDLLFPSPNVMTPFTYSFFTIEDITPPQVFSIVPVEGSTIDIRTPIQIIIIDDYSGVDINSTTILRTQDGNPINASFTATTLIDGFTLLHDPAGNEYSVGTLAIDFNSSDLANPPNVMNTMSWTYNVIEDVVAPRLANASPAPFSQGASRNTEITVRLSDNASGIDSANVVFSVNAVPINHQFLTFEKDGHASYDIIYDPINQPPFGSLVEVQIFAQDLSPASNSLDTTYTFETTLDEVEPRIVLYYPSIGSNSMTINDSLAWEVLDSLSGIDPESARLSINGVVISDGLTNSTNVTLPAADYRFRYSPLIPYAYEDTLNVIFRVSDNEIPNNTVIAEYALYTEVDEYPPYLTSRIPSAEQTRVSRNSDIFFNIKDNGLGVELDSLHLIIEEDLIPFNQLFVEVVDSGYAIRFNPPGFFEHEDTVSVRVVCHDGATVPNRMDESYWFVTLSDDREPPYLTNVVPEDSTEGWPVDVGFEFDLVDDGAGVDLSFTRIEWLDDQFWQYELETTELTDANGYHFAVTLNDPWKYSDEVIITVEARDLVSPPNVTTIPIPFSFFTEIDDAVPLILDQRPLPDSSFTFNRNFEVTLLDIKSGVDTSSVQIWIKGEDVTESAILTQLIEGWKYSYIPVGNWTVGETISARVLASDLSAHINTIDSTWTFDIIPDIAPPFAVVDSLYPIPGSSDVSSEDTIRVIVVDEGVGIDLSSLRLSIAGRVEGDGTQAIPVDLGYEFRLPLDRLDLIPGQIVSVSVSARDIESPPNTMELYKYSFNLAPPDEEFTIIPTTITPNGDGAWDEALIYHLGPASTEVKIFDMRGRLVATLAGSPAIWNAQDDSGQLVPGGLYIVQLTASGKIQQATVAVAR